MQIIMGQKINAVIDAACSKSRALEVLKKAIADHKWQIQKETDDSIRAGVSPMWLWVVREYLSDSSDWMVARVQEPTPNHSRIYLHIHIRREGFKTIFNTAWLGKAQEKFELIFSVIEHAFRENGIQISNVNEPTVG